MDSSFTFERYEIDENKKDIRFFYTLKHLDKIYNFQEVISLPSIVEIDEVDGMFQKILQSAHIALGMSYWKLFCPKKILFFTYSISPTQAEFWTKVFTKGFGEFYFKNSIHFEGLVHFPSDASIQDIPQSVELKDRSLVGIGGGKDSIVSARLLQKANLEITGFIVETQKDYQVTDHVGDALHIDTISLKRNIDPQLFDLKALPESFNGHVPISVIYACLGILSGYLYDYTNIIVSNERSSDEGNIEYLGVLINHQWSKSSEFEKLFQNYVKNTITPDLHYFSLLRPLSELQIARIFSREKEFLHIFSSCNRNFSIEKSTSRLWCRACPKCAFAFLILSAYLEKAEIQKIFGENLFDSKELQPLFKQLLGEEGHKPFECVGTPEEAKVAFSIIHERGEFEDSIAVKSFVQNTLPSIHNLKEMKDEVLSSKHSETIPKKFQSVISQIQNVCILDTFKGKKVLILGYGKEGKASEIFIQARYPDIILATADKSQSENYLDVQNEYDFVIKTPGIPKGLVTKPYTTATNIFFENVHKHQVIGVTGSKGKSTTASLIFHILKDAGKDVRLVGNIGSPGLEALLQPYSQNTIFIYELSSYQLDDISYSPHISVVVSLFPEHIPYHETIQKYFEAKHNIIQNADADDIYIYNEKFEILKSWADTFSGISLPYENDFTPSRSKLIGTHNQDNMRAAVTVARQFGIPDSICEKSISSFEPLPHRLENIGEFHGITFYDDAISTAPESTIEALNSLGTIGTLFLGGENRGYDFQLLIEKVAQNQIPNIVLFPDSGLAMRKIINSISSYNPNILTTSDMGEAVQFAFKHTKKGSICLLSTASPSYSVWKDFIEKGTLFQNFVKQYAKKNAGEKTES